MLIEVETSGKFAEAGIKIIDMVAGVQNVKDSLALELIGAGWAKAHEEAKKEEIVFAPKPEECVVDREALEAEYRALGGRVSDDWTGADLVERIEKKKAK